MISIQKAREEQKAILQNLYQLYQHDLSEFDGTLPDEFGVYEEYKYLDLYWLEAERHAYLVFTDSGAGSSPVGFALVRDLGAGVYTIAEFFIIRSARGKGLASSAASMIFDRHPGEWHVAQQQENHPAQAFWKAVISKYSKGNYEELWSDEAPVDPKQVFRS